MAIFYWVTWLCADIFIIAEGGLSADDNCEKKLMATGKGILYNR